MDFNIESDLLYCFWVYRPGFLWRLLHLSLGILPCLFFTLPLFPLSTLPIGFKCLLSFLLQLFIDNHKLGLCRKSM